jgi:hypothetical protein
MIMHEPDPVFLDDTSRYIMQCSGVGTRLALCFADTDMDCALLAFDRGALHVGIARSYTTGERFHTCIVHYFQGFMPYLLRLYDAFPDLSGQVALWLDDISRGPGLGFTEGVDPDQFALPDPMFIRSNGYQDVRAYYPDNWIPWQDRSTTVFWRGATTGHRSWARPGWHELPRFRLCQAAADARNPALFDVGINKIVQIDDPQEVQAIRASGLMRDTVPQDAYLKYRHSIDVDGNSNSWPGLFTKLLMQNTVFKIESEHGYRQWYYHQLSPWTHYIPVDKDYATLEERVAWALRYPERAYDIARNGFELSRAMTVKATIAEVGPRLRSYLQRADRRSP